MRFLQRTQFGEVEVHICTLNIASILPNAVVAVFKLSHILCFVQTAFSVWVCTETHHDKWNVFLLLTVLFDISCFCVIMQCMLLCSVILWRNSKECCLFGCDTLLVGRNLPTYVRNILLHQHYSNLRMGAVDFFKIFITLYQTTQCHISENFVLIATASRILHVYTVCCWFSHSKVL